MSHCLDTSSVLTMLPFNGCLDNKFSHISHYQDTIKSTYSGALQWLFGSQVWLYKGSSVSGISLSINPISIYVDSIKCTCVALQVSGSLIPSGSLNPNYFIILAVLLRANFRFINCCWNCE
ncbi:hypothetical protein TNCV_4515151 [Trichonephila clavipes]|nr:hypothetical protein TNCV_4515151 [Trichonephila clavipes]